MELVDYLWGYLENIHDIQSVDMANFLRFIKTVYTLSPWSVICMDSVGDARIAQWCEENGWKKSENYKNATDDRKDFFFITLPDDRDILESVVIDPRYFSSDMEISDDVAHTG